MQYKFELDGIKVEITGEGFEREKQLVIDVFEALKKYGKKTDSKKKPKNFAKSINGVKVINGINHYKTKYKCDCGYSGNRYVTEEAEKTSCHKCNNDLYLAPAHENEAHDEDFNYFIAY